ITDDAANARIIANYREAFCYSLFSIWRLQSKGKSQRRTIKSKSKIKIKSKSKKNDEPYAKQKRPGFASRPPFQQVAGFPPGPIARACGRTWLNRSARTRTVKPLRALESKRPRDPVWGNFPVCRTARPRSVRCRRC